MINGTDICAPCLWCDEPTLVAYSKDGYKNKTWMLPTDWSQVDRVSLSTIYGDGDEPLGEKEVDGIHISLALRKNQVLRIRPSGQ